MHVGREAGEKRKPVLDNKMEFQSEDHVYNLLRAQKDKKQLFSINFVSTYLQNEDYFLLTRATVRSALMAATTTKISHMPNTCAQAVRDFERVYCFLCNSYLSYCFCCCLFWGVCGVGWGCAVKRA